MTAPVDVLAWFDAYIQRNGIYGEDGIPPRAAVAELIETLDGIQQYGSDTLSGRADGGVDDRQWQREAVREMTRRARVALARVGGAK